MGTCAVGWLKVRLGMHAGAGAVLYVSCTVQSSAACSSTVRHCAANNRFKITGPVDAWLLHRAAQQRNMVSGGLDGRVCLSSTPVLLFAVCHRTVVVSWVPPSSLARRDVTLGAKPLDQDSRYARPPNVIS